MHVQTDLLQCYWLTSCTGAVACCCATCFSYACSHWVAATLLARLTHGRQTCLLRYLLFLCMSTLTCCCATCLFKKTFATVPIIFQLRLAAGGKLPQNCWRTCWIRLVRANFESSQLVVWWVQTWRHKAWSWNMKTTKHQFCVRERATLILNYVLETTG